MNTASRTKSAIKKSAPAKKNAAPKKAAAPKKTPAVNDRSNMGQDISANTEAAKGLNGLFEDMLKDIYWAEKALLKALPKLAKNATSTELTEAIDDHLAVTEEQVSRLEQVFETIGKPAKGKKCEAMDGLIKEAQEIMQSTEKGMVRDAGIIAAAQKVEHYEIATYGTLAAFARTLGENEAADLLEETLNEEKEADEQLTQVAESAVNLQAADEDEDEEEEDDDDVEEVDVEEVEADEMSDDDQDSPYIGDDEQGDDQLDEDDDDEDDDLSASNGRPRAGKSVARATAGRK